MSTYQAQLIDSYNYAKRQMFRARNKYDRGTWMLLFDWSKKELERQTALEAPRAAVERKWNTTIPNLNSI